MITTLAWAVGPAAGVVIGPLMAVLHLVAGIKSHRAWPIWTGVVLLAALAGSIWLYWHTLYLGIDYVAGPDPRSIPGHVTLLQTAALALSVTICLTLVVTAVVAVGGRDDRPFDVPRSRLS